MRNAFNRNYAPPDYITLTGELIDNDEKLLSYLEDERTRSQNYLRSNRGYKSADVCMRLLLGDDTVRIHPKLSTITLRKQRRQAREAIANGSNIRPRWKTKTFRNEFSNVVEIRNKLRDWWFYGEFVDRTIKESLTYSGGSGTGYLMLWPEMDHCTGEYKLVPTALPYKNVFPMHAAANSKTDTLYGICVWQELPLPVLHEMFPEYSGIIKSDRDTPSTFAAGFSTTKRKWAGVADWVKNKKAKDPEWSPYPVGDYYMYWIRDDSINETGVTLLMGEPGAHYSYKVPSLIDKNKQRNKKLHGRIISSDSEDYENPAAIFLSRRECKLFPYRRFIQATNYGVIYDGPPPWICRRPPVVPFRFEKVPGEWLGISLLRDGRPLERTVNNLLRSFEDSITGRNQPPIGIAKSLAKTIKDKLAGNLRLLKGMVFELDPLAAKNSITTMMDANYYDIDPKGFELVKFLLDMEDYQMGTNDFSAWNRLKQLPASDTQESLIQNLGALATDYEREIEGSILEIAEIFEDFAPQVFTQDRIITYFGKDGVSLETMDYHGNSLIPKSSPEDNRTYAERLQDHMKVFSLYASPHSIQERTSFTNKLTLLQLKKIGVPISNRKIYDMFIDDGEYDKNLKEVEIEQEQQILMASRLQKELKKANAESDMHNQLTDGIVNLIRGQSGGEGRPPNNATPPRLEPKTREGIPDSTVATN